MMKSFQSLIEDDTLAANGSAVLGVDREEAVHIILVLADHVSPVVQDVVTASIQTEGKFQGIAVQVGLKGLIFQFLFRF